MTELHDRFQYRVLVIVGRVSNERAINLEMIDREPA